MIEVGSIAVLNQQHVTRVPVRRIAWVAHAVLKAEKSKKSSLNIVLTDNSGIRVFHRRFLGKKGPTDVISFGHSDMKELGSQDHLGDLVVSVEMAKRRASTYGHTLHEELVLYVIHGILHLLGYEDHRKIQAQRMKVRQETLLKKLWKK